MSKSFPIFKKYIWSFVATVFSLASVFSPVNFVSANDWTFTDSFESQNLGDLNGQDGWAVTNYYGNPRNAVTVSPADASQGTNYVEMTNQDSMIVTHEITPINAGVFQFRMRHNKSGLFYFYALTSDQGGQLLFSIQFTESNGILLEKANKQITLLPNYNADQWYLFTIDFDNSRGERGTFKIKIDDGSYGEYEYVNSESGIFDFAQMVFGSESNGTAISAFSDIQSTPSTPTIIDIIDSGATPLAPLPDTAPVDSTSTPTSTPAPVIQENGDGSATLISI